MAYNATYDSADIAPASIDAIVEMIVMFGFFASLIALLILYRWSMGKKVI